MSAVVEQQARTSPAPPVPVLPPASGAWREGDHPGRRQFADVGDVVLERGGVVPDVRVAYETWGRPNAARDNAVLVLHALTGDSHVAGPVGAGHPTPGWWDAMVGPGRPLDTDRFWVVAPNVLGGCQGTTGPASIAPDGRPWGSRWPFVTVRDQVLVESLLADHLGISSWAGVVGGSMGGMRAVEWAVTEPDRVRSALVLASTAAASADQIAWCAPQLRAITSDPRWRGGDYHDAPDGEGPHVGLGIARSIAHVTYRSEEELSQRFGRGHQGQENPLGGGGRYAVESYLDHHADKLAARFDAGSYVTLTAAMSSHDVGRDRGGVAAALARVSARTLVLAINSDRLYPPRLSEEMAAALPGGEPVRLVRSPYGHDAFLIETGPVGAAVRELLSEVRTSSA